MLSTRINQHYNNLYAIYVYYILILCMGTRTTAFSKFPENEIEY